MAKLHIRPCFRGSRERRTLKKTTLYRKKSLFYKTRNKARTGDCLRLCAWIHPAKGVGGCADGFEYLTKLQRHAEKLKQKPSEWMPWHYCETLARLATAARVI